MSKTYSYLVNGLLYYTQVWFLNLITFLFFERTLTLLLKTEKTKTKTVLEEAHGD